MMFASINRNDPEKIFTTVLVQTATVVEGDVMKWSDTGSAAYPLGKAVIKVAAITDLLIAGVIWNYGKTTTINIDDYCLMQIYGPHGNVKVTGALASSGLSLKPSATAGTCEAGAAADDPSLRLGVSMAAVSGGRAAVFLKCM